MSFYVLYAFPQAAGFCIWCLQSQNKIGWCLSPFRYIGYLGARDVFYSFMWNYSECVFWGPREADAILELVSKREVGEIMGEGTGEGMESLQTLLLVWLLGRGNGRKSFSLQWGSGKSFLGCWGLLEQSCLCEESHDGQERPNSRTSACPGPGWQRPSRSPAPARMTWWPAVVAAGGCQSAVLLWAGDLSADTTGRQHNNVLATRACKYWACWCQELWWGILDDLARSLGLGPYGCSIPA